MAVIAIGVVSTVAYLKGNGKQLHRLQHQLSADRCVRVEIGQGAMARTTVELHPVEVVVAVAGAAGNVERWTMH
jgi:hypothetical protein